MFREEVFVPCASIDIFVIRQICMHHLAYDVMIQSISLGGSLEEGCNGGLLSIFNVECLLPLSLGVAVNPWKEMARTLVHSPVLQPLGLRCVQGKGPFGQQHLTPSVVDPSRPLALLEENSIILITLMEEEHLVVMETTCHILERRDSLKLPLHLLIVPLGC